MSDRTIIRINLDLTQRQADLLRTNTMQEFYLEQDGRFEHYDGPDPRLPMFRGGTMHWCTTSADWLLLRAWEMARGFAVAMLSDLAGLEQNPNGSWPDSCVLLTSEPFEHWMEHTR